MTKPDAATFIAALNGLEKSGDAKEIAALFRGDARISNPLMTETGREGAARFWTAYRSAFSRIASSFTSILEQDGRICLEWTSSGEIEGQAVAYEGVSMLEVDETGISAFRTYFDPTRLGASRPAQA